LRVSVADAVSPVRGASGCWRQIPGWGAGVPLGRGSGRRTRSRCGGSPRGRGVMIFSGATVWARVP
jgi:hypothetical protein